MQGQRYICNNIAISEPQRKPMAAKLQITSLTTCDIADGGNSIQLHMQDDAGEPVTLHLPCVLASSLILTLPNLMTRCMQLLSGTEVRLVFPMNAWTLEATAGTGELILTLKTPDGFAAAFAISAADASGLAESLSV